MMGKPRGWLRRGFGGVEMQNLDVNIPHGLTAPVCPAFLAGVFVVGCPETTPNPPTHHPVA